MAVNDAYFNDNVLDALLNYINGTSPAATMKLYLCNTVVANNATDATVDAAALAPSVTPTFQAIAAGTPSGRELEIDTKDFAVDTNGTANCFVITDSTNVVYVQELAATQAVTSGQTWTLPAVTITIPEYDAA